MAYASSTENWFVADHNLDVDEFSNIDEETLRMMIQSLEPEVMMDQDSEYQFSDLDQLQSCCSDHHLLDFQWFDMEMAYGFNDQISSSNFNGHDFVEKIMVDEGLHDYSQLCYGMMMEQDNDDHYIGLWQ